MHRIGGLVKINKEKQYEMRLEKLKMVLSNVQEDVSLAEMSLTIEKPVEFSFMQKMEVTKLVQVE